MGGRLAPWLQAAPGGFVWEVQGAMSKLQLGSLAVSQGNENWKGPKKNHPAGGFL